MFCRLDKPDEPIFQGRGGRIYEGAYVREADWIAYFMVYIMWVLYKGCRINGILRYHYMS